MKLGYWNFVGAITVSFVSFRKRNSKQKIIVLLAFQSIFPKLLVKGGSSLYQENETIKKDQTMIQQMNEFIINTAMKRTTISNARAGRVEHSFWNAN